MVTHHVDFAAEHQEACAEALRALGHDARYVNTGGGCMAVVVELASKDQLTIGFANSEEAWVGADFTDDDGEIIAWVQIGVRPYGGTHGDADSPAASAEAVDTFIRRLR